MKQLLTFISLTAFTNCALAKNDPNPIPELICKVNQSIALERGEALLVEPISSYIVKRGNNGMKFGVKSTYSNNWIYSHNIIRHHLYPASDTNIWVAGGATISFEMNFSAGWIFKPAWDSIGSVERLSCSKI